MGCVLPASSCCGLTCKVGMWWSASGSTGTVEDNGKMSTEEHLKGSQSDVAHVQEVGLNEYNVHSDTRSFLCEYSLVTHLCRYELNLNHSFLEHTCMFITVAEVFR